MKFHPETLTAARVAAGLSVVSLADKATVGQATIYAIERGHHASPRQDVLSKLAGALSVEWQVFFAPPLLESETA